ncbi:M20/M25/M40 family metallo-hydrolase [Lentilactobacillus parakefiri]|uniref:Peptidase M20 dimerisation domain-containing protein n=1 Tax=Lentilactobacillus parakefiri TaxID=152332 RepID=A0A269Y3L1_9LACO|nr:M20/M25/M40 family metallo-hydrolase [Lentilactobacillus parakefiri]PAK80147.1 hypothetical protein B8W98_08555 [Lentilactobacillus parakefiri]
MDNHEKLQILKDLISFRTVNDNEHLVTAYIHDLLAKHGIPSTFIKYAENRDNLVAEFDTGNPGPVLGFSGHADVVHEGTLSTWTTPPFEPNVRNNRLYGRGAADMKGGLAGLTIAFISLVESKNVHSGIIRLYVTMGEEVGELGSKLLADKGYVDDLDAVVIGEPSGVSKKRLDAYVDSGGAKFTPELAAKLHQVSYDQKAPEQHFIFFAHKGWLMYEVVAHGKAAHSSMPKMGINAIDMLVNYYLKEKQFYQNIQASDPILGETVYAPTVIAGGKQINSIPDTASLKVKIRTIPEFDNQTIIKKLHQLIDDLNQQPDYKLTIDITSKRPVINHPGSAVIDIAQKAGAHHLHESLDLPTIGVSLGTDASEYTRVNQKMDVVVLGPGNTTSHQHDEYIDLDTYYNMIDTYEEIGQQYLK